MTKKIRNETSVKAVFKFQPNSSLKRPLLGTHVPAGFPSPAQDYVEAMLDLNEYLIAHPQATFFIRAEGFSMIDAGIRPDDLLIVDRGLEAADNKIVIAVIDGELTVKRLRIINGIYWLYPDNPAYEPMQITTDLDFIIWGVVTYIIHKV